MLRLHGGSICAGAVAFVAIGAAACSDRGGSDPVAGTETGTSPTSGPSLTTGTADDSTTRSSEETGVAPTGASTETGLRPDVGDPVGCGGSSVVELAQPEPVFLMSEIPFSGAQGPPFAHSMYLPAGYFVVAGALNINVGLNPSGQWLGGGQYVLTEHGELVGIQHIAYDARGAVPNGCGEGIHFQSPDMDRVGTSSFVRTPRGDDVQGSVFQLQPLHYDVTAGGVSLLGTPDIVVAGSNDCQLERNYRTTAVAAGAMVAVEEIPGGSTVGTRNVVLSLPGFEVVAEASVQDCNGNLVPAVTPLFGLGTYVVARTHEYTQTNPLDGQPFPQGCTDAGGIDLYALRDDSLSWVQNLQDPADYIRNEGGVVQILPLRVQDYTIDALDDERVAIAFYTWGDSEIQTRRLMDGQLALEASTSIGTATVQEISLAGPYLARVEQADNEQVKLQEDGVELAVPAPPRDPGGSAVVTTVELSAADTMLVGQRSQLALYRIECP